MKHLLERLRGRKRLFLGSLLLGLQALLSVIFLPLWEGFDEPFHYSYVHSLRSLTAPSSTPLSSEIWRSVLRYPGSYVVQQNLPGIITYEAYFRCEPHCVLPMKVLPPANYEAHHPPLAYAILAVPDYALSSFTLESRIIALRSLCTAIGLTLTVAGWRRFANRLNLSQSSFIFGLFALGCSPMYWATVDHLANDWLSVGLAALLLAAVTLPRGSPQRSYEVCQLILLGAVTKAYFLPLCLLILLEIRSLLILRRRQQLLLAFTALLVVGWYGHNAVGGNLMGLQELQTQPKATLLIDSALKLDWWSESSALLRSALWTGNSSFLSYSRCILWGQAIWLAIGCISFFKFTKRATLSPFVIIFTAALAGSIILSNWYTQGKSAGTSPWYAQPLYLCALFAAVSSIEHLPFFYRRAGLALSLLIFIPTVPLKYVPWYTAMSDGKVTVSMLRQMNWPELIRRSEIVFGQPAWLLATTCIVTIALALFQASLLAATERHRGKPTFSDT